MRLVGENFSSPLLCVYMEKVSGNIAGLSLSHNLVSLEGRRHAQLSFSIFKLACLQEHS